MSHRSYSEIGPWRTRFERPSKLRIKRRNRQMDMQEIRSLNLHQQWQISDNQIRFRKQRPPPTLAPGEYFQDRPRPPKSPLSRLIRIGRRPNRDRIFVLDLPQFPAQQLRRVRLGVDLVLEVPPISHFHEF